LINSAGVIRNNKSATAIANVRALLNSALFVVLLFCWPCCSPLQAELVSQIIDGDTFILDDGTTIRLLGIDTPEMQHHNQTEEPYARASQEQLLYWLKQQDYEVHLEFDQQRTDRYRRTLAYAYLKDGTDLGERLLQEGLATQLILPPNVSHVDRYAKAETAARRAGKNIWKDNLRVITTDQIDAAGKGYRAIQGTVTTYNQTRHVIWLSLDNKLTVKLTREDARTYFSADMLNRLKNAGIEVRGELYRYRGQWRLKLHHPAQLRFL
jgi:endonuclease YncB( thermonuclease family)